MKTAAKYPNPAKPRRPTVRSFFQSFGFRYFRFNQKQCPINQATEALRRDWSYLETYSLPLEAIKDRSAVFIRKVTDNEHSTEAYVKIYANRKYPFQRYLRKGKAYTEVRNLLFFQSIQIPTPRILAWGERRNRIGRIIQEFIITEAVPGALQLDQFAKHDESNRPLRRKIAEQLGGWTRAMHDRGFIHEDLKWRNILVSVEEDTPGLFWIDCPKGGFYKASAMLERKKLKDCATLDKLARFECTKAERAAFVRAYLGTGATHNAISSLCHKIETYRNARFDAKDDRQRADARKES